MHRLAPECKVLTLLGFVLAVAVTPRESVWAFGIYSLLLVALLVAASLRMSFVARRLTIEIPFVLFALALPFMGGGETREILGVAVHVEGLWAAWNILVKATLGLAATIILAATTPAADILRGLERLRVPKLMTAVAGFMIRYADVVTGEMKRMSVARASRGHDPRWLWQARALAGSAATLFVRSYERGERVYMAMTARGYTGGLPSVDERRATSNEWALALVAIVAMVTLAVAGWAVR